MLPLLALAGLIPTPQDPPAPVRPPQRPAGPTQPAPAANPLLGAWRLHSAVRGLQAMPPGAAQGYLMVTERHLSLHLIVTVPGSERPVVQTAFRSYTRAGSRLVTTALSGVRNTASGDLMLDSPGLVETRTVTPMGDGRLRIAQGDEDYLDFVRLE